MKLNEHRRSHELLKRNLYARCKDLDARIAIVGTKSSALILLDAIEGGDIPVAGIFESEESKVNSIVNSRTVQSIEELAELNPSDVVIIASSADVTDLYETFTHIQSLCSSKVLPMKSLMDSYLLREGLKEPLEFAYDEYLFGRGLFPQDGENPYWHHVFPDTVDFSDKTVLELGPFEANNTVMLMAKNPKKVIGIEVKPLNFAKISVMQSIYNWNNFELILGDMHIFPQLLKDKIDIIYCSGVLYHSDKPWWLLRTCMENCKTVILGSIVSSEYPSGHREMVKVDIDEESYHLEVRQEDEKCHSGLKRKRLLFSEEELFRFVRKNGFQYKKYGSTIIAPFGLWVFALLTKRSDA